MSTRDPFLTTIGVVLDRIAVFAALSFGMFALLWEGIAVKALAMSTADSWALVSKVLTRNGASFDYVLVGLVLLQSIELAGALALWLFRRWQREASLQESQLRGTRKEGF
jgi:hypothetical protein